MQLNQSACILNNHGSHTEKEWLTLLNQGSEQAFEQLYRLYSPRIFGNLIKLVKSEDVAQELLQEVFIKIWQKRHTLDPEQSFRSYLFRVAENSVYDFFRKAARDKALEARLTEAVAHSYSYVEEALLHKDNSRILEKALASLPAQRRKVFELCKLEGRSYKEVSALLQISISTVSDHIVKATKTLKEFYNNQGDAALTLANYFNSLPPVEVNTRLYYPMAQRFG